MIIDSTSPRKYKYHPYGDSRVCLDKQNNRAYILVHIPKCASSWMKPVFGDGKSFNWLTGEYYESVDQEFANSVKNASKHFVCVLRDPVQRWISGFAQTKPDLKMTWKQVLDQIVFDNHTEPQISFLHRIDTDNCTWFYCNQDLKKTVTNWIAKQPHDLFRIPNDSNNNSYNITQDKDTESVKIYKQIQHFLNTSPNAVKILQRFYQQDYDLINSLNFYEARQSNS
jgi:hypothetical protein